ncbi:MAG: hypothetical protein JWM68_2369 [Verrucomicrobiales bacterium]|nr:hypothetical protein [Verrucomicrobiales bacterium]
MTPSQIIKMNRTKLLFQLLPLAAIVTLLGCSKHGGKVVDAKSNEPIPNALVFHNGNSTRSDSHGKFILTKFDAKEPVLVKLPGFRGARVKAEKFSDSTVRLEPLQVKGVYLSFGALKTDSTREATIALINGTDLNTLVVDIKNERGYLSIDCDGLESFKIPRASPPSIDDVQAFLKDLHSRNIYVIGRIITFRDDALAHARPDWAVIDVRTGKPWTDGAKMKWGDAFRTEVQDYNIAVAKATAEAGFDEIQFANVGFPGGNPENYKYSKESSFESRRKALDAFWDRANKELARYPVYISMEFWGPNIFQKDNATAANFLKNLDQHVDYISPSLYLVDLAGRFPHSGKSAKSFPYRAISETIKRCETLLGSAKKLRPWLQNYESTAMGKVPFQAHEVALGMQAAVDAGVNGFLLWNGASKYTNTVEALKIFASGPVKPEADLSEPKGTNEVELAQP